jgi:hypothetical protein
LLIQGGDDHLPAAGSGPGVHPVHQNALHLQSRSERLLGRDPGPSRLELEELLTASCTESYTLEAQRLRTKRRMVSALADASPGRAGEAREEVRGLLSRYCSITRELERVAVVIARLRARLQEVDPA